ncbi:DUF302 domain-containing protein [Mycolicibacterium vinylchloridicum]|uniref:DUF302 domain-containing protein n=1 Tax=Mycolicibacterium vinylchloridicum TaxID=2736928 RepID=UPI0015C9A151|nr:DUF302 domain-containing protein [Mycolicibacterium vinylchloridicum]
MTANIVRSRRLLLATAAGAAIATFGLSACGGATTTTATPSVASTVAPSQPSPAAPDSAQSLRTSLVTTPSSQPFDATVAALKQAVSSNGMMILGELDQAGALRTTGLQLTGAHTFFVGNPAVGKMFFEQNPAIGTVLPLQMYVWEDSAGQTNISYFDPSPLFRAVDPHFGEGGQKMADAAAMITQAAAGPGSESATGSAQNASLVTVDTNGSFDDAVDRLKQAVSTNGMMILGDLDQAGALETTGLRLRGAHTFFVGNPAVGKTFFEQTAAIGTVLPIRVLVWADQDGKTHVSYFNPEPLFSAVDPQLASGGAKMASALTMITDAVQ